MITLAIILLSFFTASCNYIPNIPNYFKSEGDLKKEENEVLVPTKLPCESREIALIV